MLESDIQEICSSVDLKPFEGKRVLITGGNGFLGCYFTEVLARGGAQICVLDNARTSTAFLSCDRKSISYRVWDVCSGDLQTITGWPRAEFILHLAGIASPFHYRKWPLETLKVATTGLTNVLDFAEGPEGVLFFSSSEIYGDPTTVPTPETYNGNLSTLSARACFSEDTEILTGRGWVKFPELLEQDTVASLSEDGGVSYSIPDEIISYPYVGTMQRFCNQKMDLLVTPNHRMLVTHKERFWRADDSRKWEHTSCPTGGVWEEFEGPSEWQLPPAPRNSKVVRNSLPIDVWLEFLGLYLAEGCVYSQERAVTVNGVGYATTTQRILLAHDHGWKRDRIRACLEKMPYRFHVQDHQYEVINAQLAKALEPFGKKSLNKKLTREILDLPPSKLRILFDALMLDGSKDGRAFFTSSPEMLDGFTELALKVGKAVSVSLNSGSNHWSDRPNWRVNLRPAVPAYYSQPESVRYSGRVYCVSVPPHRTVLVKRNGKICFSGNCYDESKRLGETICKVYHEQFGVPVSIVRPFNVYGPGMRQDDYRVLPQIAASIVSKKPFQIYGSGKQTRTFCYVTDAIRGFLTVLTKGRAGEAYNVGNPYPEVSVSELVERVKRDVEIDFLSNKFKGGDRYRDPSIDVYPQEYPGDEPQRRCPDIRKLEALGFEPQVTLGNGLRRFFGWALEEYRA